jgi:Xaa-Pro aminopeptidase
MPAAGLASQPISGVPTIPFDADHLDALLESAGLDCILVNSRHNIEYLLGGYWFFFFDNFDALGISRYLPLLIYPRGRRQDAVYIGNSMEACEAENGRFWCPTVVTVTSGSRDAAELAVSHLRRLGLAEKAIGMEASFMPSDAADALKAGLPYATLSDCHLPLERLRLIKRPDELALIRGASELVVDSMLATFTGIRPGMTKRQVSDLLKQEETNRGLRFDYCLISLGTSFNRAPNDQIVREGDILSLDSGGNHRGFFGDLCRMGIVGEPDAELEELLSFIDRIQQKARDPIRPGTPGRAIFDAVAPLLDTSPLKADTHFVAHGMGIIGHEGAAADLDRAGQIPRHRCRRAAPARHGALDRDHAAASQEGLHQARGHRRRDRRRLGRLWRWWTWLEPRGSLKADSRPAPQPARRRPPRAPTAISASATCSRSASAHHHRTRSARCAPRARSRHA